MSRFTKVSPYKSGEVRFGRKAHSIDTTVKTVQLTDDELERYKNGESIDEILKERNDMENKETVIKSKRQEEGKKSDNGSIQDTNFPKVISFARYQELEEKYKSLEENFEAVSLDKENAIKEIAMLKNQIESMRERFVSSETIKDEYFDKMMNLETELQALRKYTYTKLKQELYQ